MKTISILPFAAVAVIIIAVVYVDASPVAHHDKDNVKNGNQWGQRGQDQNDRNSDRRGNRGQDQNGQNSDRRGNRGQDQNGQNSDRRGNRGQDQNGRNSDRRGNQGQFNRPGGQFGQNWRNNQAGNSISPGVGGQPNGQGQNRFGSRTMGTNPTK